MKVLWVKVAHENLMKPRSQIQKCWFEK